MVHCLNAVLIFPKILQTEQLSGLFLNDKEEKNKTTEESKDKLDEQEGNDKNKNFWWAYDILRKY